MAAPQFTIGARVQRSRYALEPLRMAVLGAGTAHRQRLYREEYDRKQADRGTVSGRLDSGGLDITWDDGTWSRCLDYMVSLAQ